MVDDEYLVTVQLSDSVWEYYNKGCARAFYGKIFSLKSNYSSYTCEYNVFCLEGSNLSDNTIITYNGISRTCVYTGDVFRENLNVPFYASGGSKITFYIEEKKITFNITYHFSSTQQSTSYLS